MDCRTGQLLEHGARRGRTPRKTRGHRHRCRRDPGPRASPPTTACQCPNDHGLPVRASTIAVGDLLSRQRPPFARASSIVADRLASPSTARSRPPREIRPVGPAARRDPEAVDEDDQRRRRRIARSICSSSRSLIDAGEAVGAISSSLSAAPARRSSDTCVDRTSSRVLGRESGSRGLVPVASADTPAPVAETTSRAACGLYL